MKKILLTCIQIGITVGLLYWIFSDPKKNEGMLNALHTANLLWLAPGIISVGLAFLFQTQRWRVLLKVQGIDMGWWRTLRVYFIGAFFNLFLLGSTGGDVVKIFYAMRETSSKKGAALLSVMVDRMMGLVALIVVATVLFLLRWALLMSNAVTQGLLGTLALILGGSLGLIILGFFVDRLQLADKLPSWLPLHGKIIELSVAFSTYARAPKVLATAFGLSIPAHCLNFLAFFFAARAFGTFPGWKGLGDIFCVLPIITTIASLPASLSGVGVREGLFQKIFTTLFGTPESVAVMISITGFLMTVFWGLVGGLVYLVYRPSGGLHIKEMQQEVSALEESIEKTA